MHAPLTHVVMPGHTFPQKPQLLLSVCTSTHALVQHVGEPLPHALKQAPQFALSLAVSAQYCGPASGVQSFEPEHCVAHALFEQTWLDGHTLPHDPQLALS